MPCVGNHLLLSEFLTQLSFAFSVTGPIFVLVFLGVLLKRLQVIDQSFTDTASKIVFNVALPAVLFFGVANTDIRSVLNPAYLSLAALGTLATFVMISLLSRRVVSDPRDRGVFVQGAFRSNLAIIGLAFVINAYGEQGLALGSIFISVVTVLYNILSIYTLRASLKQGSIGFVQMVVDITKNPLIVSIFAGVLANLVQLPIPDFVQRSGEYIGYLSLPLALICIGGTLSFSEFKSSSTESLVAVFAKLILVPLIVVYPAYLWGFTKMEMGVLFLMVASPTAAAAYIMVKGMGGNDKLAANIILISTLGSLVTVSFGLAFLKRAGVV